VVVLLRGWVVPVVVTVLLRAWVVPVAVTVLLRAWVVPVAVTVLLRGWVVPVVVVVVLLRAWTPLVAALVPFWAGVAAARFWTEARPAVFGAVFGGRSWWRGSACGAGRTDFRGTAFRLPLRGATFRLPFRDAARPRESGESVIADSVCQACRDRMERGRHSGRSRFRTQADV
jgi:hypothetical protein